MDDALGRLSQLPISTPQDLKTLMTFGVTPSSLPIGTPGSSTQPRDADIGTPASRKLPPRAATILADEHAQRLIDELKQQNEFLTDQVKRLNVELSRYQLKYPEFNAKVSTGGPLEQTLNEDEPIPPWLLSPQLLSPLLVSYDNALEELTAQVKFYKEELEQLSLRTKELIKENETLRETEVKLTRNLLGKDGSAALSSLPQDVGQPDVLSNIEVRELREKLELYKDELERMRTQNERQREELEQLRAEALQQNAQYLALQKEHEDTRGLLRQAEKTAEHLDTEAKRLQAELEVHAKENSSLKEELNKARGDRRALTNTVNDSKRVCEELVAQRDALIKECNALTVKERELSMRVASLESQLEYANERYRRAEQDLEGVRRDRNELYQSISKLEKRIIECEQKELLAFHKVNESTRAVEEAQLERDQAIVRQEQAAREASRLTDRLHQLALELKEKHEKELEELRHQTALQMAKQAGEIKELEGALADMKASMERAIREKRAAEAEADRLRKVPPSEVERLRHTVDELANQVRVLEREKEAAVQAAHSSSLAVRRAAHANDKERSHYQSKVAELADLVKRKDREAEEYRVECTRLQALLEDSQRDLAVLMKEREASERRAQKDLQQIQRQAEDHIHDLSARLDEALEAYERVEAKNHSLTVECQRLKNAWRDAASSAHAQYERQISDLKADCARLLTRNEELAATVAALTAQKSEILASASQLTAMRKQWEEAEAKAAAAKEQIVHMLKCQEELQTENRELLAKLERLSLQNGRMKSSSQQPVRDVGEDEVAEIGRQKKTFTKWINSRLSSVKRTVDDDVELVVHDLQTDFCDGVLLMHLIHSLFGIPIPSAYRKRGVKKALMRPHMFDNAALAMSMLEKAAVNVPFLKPSNLVDGDLKMILGMVWQIIVAYQMLQGGKRKGNDDSEGGLEKNAKELLLQWCQEKTANYHGVHIDNFSISFSDGLALCALMHSLVPERFSFENLRRDNKRANMELAFQVGEELGVPRLLEVDQMTEVEKPDERSVMTYVWELYVVDKVRQEKERGRREEEERLRKEQEIARGLALLEEERKKLEEERKRREEEERRWREQMEREREEWLRKKEAEEAAWRRKLEQEARLWAAPPHQSASVPPKQMVMPRPVAEHQDTYRKLMGGDGASSGDDDEEEREEDTEATTQGVSFDQLANHTWKGSHAITTAPAEHQQSNAPRATLSAEEQQREEERRRLIEVHRAEEPLSWVRLDQDVVKRVVSGTAPSTTTTTTQEERMRQEARDFLAKEREKQRLRQERARGAPIRPAVNQYGTTAPLTAITTSAGPTTATPCESSRHDVAVEKAHTEFYEQSELIGQFLKESRMLLQTIGGVDNLATVPARLPDHLVEIVLQLNTAIEQRWKEVMQGIKTRYKTIMSSALHSSHQERAMRMMQTVSSQFDTFSKEVAAAAQKASAQLPPATSPPPQKKKSPKPTPMHAKGPSRYAATSVEESGALGLLETLKQVDARHLQETGDFDYAMALDMQLKEKEHGRGQPK